jgi:tetratricopeptide (TPR) repeat protein
MRVSLCRAVTVSIVALAGAFALLAPGARPAIIGAASPAPIAIVGVDGADWQAVDPLVAAGRLPTFAALKAGGAVGTMRPEPPLLSPIIWTTVITGRRPEDHGVLDFMVDQPGGGQAPVGGGARRTKALWEIFSDADRPVLVAGWWATWPADRVRGALVTDRVAVPHIRLSPGDAGLVYPPERLPDVKAALVSPEAVDYPSLNRLVPLTRAEYDEAVRSEGAPNGRFYRDRFAHARAALAAARTYRAATVKLLPSVRPSFVAVYFELVDTVSHLFVGDPRRGAAAIGAAYAEIDQQINDLARALDPDALVVVLSDHGFYQARAGIPDDPSDLASAAAAWHRPYGLIAATTAGALAGTRPAPKMSPLGNVSPLDIAPTVLARAGLPVASDMPGRAVPALTGGGSVTNIASYGLHRLPDQPSRDSAVTKVELERLRALGYVSGASAVTTQARVNLGEILFRKGEIKDATRELEAAVRADPANQRAALWLARAYAASNRADDAVRVYDRLVQAAEAGEDVDPLIVLAATDLDLSRGRRAAAADRLSHVRSSLAQRPEILIARAAIAEADGTPDGEQLLRAALAREPASIDALSRLIDLLLHSGRAAAAARAAIDSAQRFPDSPERRALVGETALAERRPADAASAFRAALGLAPDAPSVRLELARAELMQHRADQALDALGDLATLEADILRGASYSTRNDWPAAVRSYTRAAARTSPSVDLLNALGYAQLEAGRPVDALATLERSLSVNSDQPAIRALADRARRNATPARP